MTNREMIAKLRELEKNRKNVGADLTLWALINLLISYFNVRGVER